MQYWVNQNITIKSLRKRNNKLRDLIDYIRTSNEIVKTTIINIIKDNEINKKIKWGAIDLRQAAKNNFMEIREYEEEIIRNKSIVKRYQNGIER